MGILTKFTDIISANINALFDGWEDPSKMLDQYQRKLVSDLEEVKRETAGVMAEESRTKRLVEENNAEIAKYTELVKKALLAQNDEDAGVFLTKVEALEAKGASLLQVHTTAYDNSIKIRKMLDKLTADINELESKRQMLIAKAAVAKTTSRLSTIGSSTRKSEGAMGAFNRMEEKIDRELDTANAMLELGSKPRDKAYELEMKYHNLDVSESVRTRMAAMKSELGLTQQTRKDADSSDEE